MRFLQDMKGEVGTFQGVHGLRWYNDELQFQQWVGNGLKSKPGAVDFPFDVVNPSLEIRQYAINYSMD